MTLGADEVEMLFARSTVVVASIAAGLAPPVAPVSSNYRNVAAYVTTTNQLKRMGFVGRVAMHPNQLAIIHQVFGVAPEELKAAEQMVERYDAATKTGSGVIVGDDGRMIDEAVVRLSRRTIALAHANNPQDAQ